MAEQELLRALLDELEPAWREAYSDPLNYVRVLHQKVELQRFVVQRLRAALGDIRDDVLPRPKGQTVGYLSAVTRLRLHRENARTALEASTGEVRSE